MAMHLHGFRLSAGTLHLPSRRTLPVDLELVTRQLPSDALDLSLRLVFSEEPPRASWVELLLVFGAGSEVLLEVLGKGRPTRLHGVFADSPPNPWRGPVRLRFTPRDGLPSGIVERAAHTACPTPRSPVATGIAKAL